MDTILADIVDFIKNPIGAITALIGLIAAILGLAYTILKIIKKIKEIKEQHRTSALLKITNLNLSGTNYSETKELRFQLVNDGKTTVILKTMKLTISECGPNKNLRMIVPGAELQVYEYNLDLDPNQSEYEIISSNYTKEKPPLFYKNGEADAFLIKISSQQAYWYQFSILVIWYSTDKPNEIRNTQSREMRIEFSKTEPEEILDMIDL
ncbi:MAG: hypothetical protein ACFFCE_06595 [Promethearchaeota archaeon]